MVYTFVGNKVRGVARARMPTRFPGVHFVSGENNNPHTKQHLLILFSAFRTQAAYIIAEHSGDAEVETFFDLVFSSHSSRERKNLASLHDDTDGDRVRHQEARDSMEDLEDLDLLAALVQSSSSMTSHQYRR